MRLLVNNIVARLSPLIRRLDFKEKVPAAHSMQQLGLQKNKSEREAVFRIWSKIDQFRLFNKTEICGQLNIFPDPDPFENFMGGLNLVPGIQNGIGSNQFQRPDPEPGEKVE